MADGHGRLEAAVADALVAEGFEAPLVGDLADRPLAEVCEAIEHAAPEPTESVPAEWVGARPAGEAAAEPAACCVNGPSASARRLAWAGLVRHGELAPPPRWSTRCGSRSSRAWPPCRSTTY